MQLLKVIFFDNLQKKITIASVNAALNLIFFLYILALVRYFINIQQHI